MKKVVIKILILLVGLCTIGINQIFFSKSLLRYLTASILGVYVYYLFGLVDRGHNASKQYKFGLSLVSVSTLLSELLLLISSKI